MKNVHMGGREATSTDLSHTTSSPLWTPGKKTDFTNTREPKLKHTIYTVNKKDTYTQREIERGRDKDNMHMGGDREDGRQDKDPDQKHLVLGTDSTGRHRGSQDTRWSDTEKSESRKK